MLRFLSSMNACNTVLSQTSFVNSPYFFEGNVVILASNLDTLLQELDLSCEAILDFDTDTSIRLPSCACPPLVRELPFQLLTDRGDIKEGI